ncbi:MAG: hypothetical protein H0X66_04925 [Verrucomicrobia bacterium]|nr:hypothetical protein [Verrucomicrobiota bacterium]
MIQPEELVGEEWAEWYRLTPVQRWLESEKLWQTYLALGGSLDPEPDTQSPFFDARTTRSRPTHGGQACVFYGAAEVGSFLSEKDGKYFEKYIELASRKATGWPKSCVLILLDCEVSVQQSLVQKL